MLDFAASLLAELERWMLTASPAMVDLNTFCDTSDKLVGPVSVVEEVQRRLHTDEVPPGPPPAAAPCPARAPEPPARGCGACTRQHQRAATQRAGASAQEVSRKRRYGRLQKAMGDVSLLAGSPSDAADHYATALELARVSGDAIWAGASLEGVACAKARGRRARARPAPAAPLARAGRAADGPGRAAQVLDACLSSGALRSLSLPAPGSPPESPPRHQAVAALQAEAAASAAPSGASRASSGFGGPAFWAALREVDDLERDVRELLAEARQVLRRRGALSLVVRAPRARARARSPARGAARAPTARARSRQVEQDLAYARLLAGLHGVRARREVADLVGGLVEVGAGLPLPEDKLTTIMEAAQVPPACRAAPRARPPAARRPAPGAARSPGAPAARR